jgi:hypothetical protein
MAETDWIEMANSLDANTIARGVTAGTTKPQSNPGNDFVYGWNSLLSTEGAHGLYVDQPSYNPLQNDALNPTGGSVRAAIKRGVGGGGALNVGFAPMIAINLQAADVEAQGYLLGLEDADPARIVLVKGAPRAGLPTATALRISSSAFQADTWVHLRLDAIFNANGDVVLNVFQSSGTNVETPNWQPIAGMDSYIDDAIAVNTGSLPLSGGFVGYAFYTNDLQKRAYIDHVEVLRQK